MRLARKHQWKRFGYASVSFSQPISSKEYCENHGINFSKLESTKRFEQVAIFADQLMHEIEKAVPIVPLVLIASLFISLKGESIKTEALKQKAKQLIQTIESKGAQILFPNPDKWVNLEGALEMLLLRRLIEDTPSGYRVTKDSEIVLCYYSNSIAHWLG